jgi:hypothetical protein
VAPAALLAAAALVVAAVLAPFFIPRTQPGPAAPQPAAPQPAAPERALTYSVTAQRVRGGEPFQLTHEMIFEKGFRVRLNVGSPDAGYLYAVNEGPVAKNDAPSYVVLFPTETTNGGSARMDAGGSLQIPEKSWFVFDEQEGTEKVWLVWSADPVPALEALAPFENRREKGLVTDPALAAALRDFLATQSAARPRAEPDEDRKETTLRGPGPVLTHLVRFEHR